MLPVFLFGFFLALVSSYFESSPFLRDWSGKIFVRFVCPSPGGSVLEECVWICLFWGFLLVVFHMSVSGCWVCCSELRSSYLRFFSGLLS